MLDRIRMFRCLSLVLFVILCGARAIAADAVWHVGKSSGEVWLTDLGIERVALTGDAILKPGDSIRTGQNGRVLLVRGEESILISPNSAVGIPREPKQGLATTIIQQAGSILLEVEKRNVKHFEVETPYFAAVVKGTQFRVTVDKNDASVNVLRGQVEVSDFKSGQYALVLPGQLAKVLARGVGGLSLSGSGTLSPIKKGEPRGTSVKFLEMPEDGPAVPAGAPKEQQVRTASAVAPISAASDGGGREPLNGSSTSKPTRNNDTGLPRADSVSVSGNRILQSGNNDTGLPRASSAPVSGSTILQGGNSDAGSPRANSAPVSGNGIWQGQPVRTASEENAGRTFESFGWSSGANSTSDHPRNSKGDIGFDLTLSGSIGAIVAFAVAVQRVTRRRRRTPT